MGEFIRHLVAVTRRLGYIKILTWLSNDTSPSTVDTLSKRLYNTVKGKQEKWLECALSRTGSVSEKTATDYVNLACQLKFLDSKYLTRGFFGNILSKTKVFEDLDHQIKNSANEMGPFYMQRIEKILFLRVLLEKDILCLLPLIRWILLRQRENVESNKGIISKNFTYGEEGIFPKAHEYLAKLTSDPYERKSLNERAKKLKNIPVKDDNYAKHQTVPRLEFLTDLQILDKKEVGGEAIYRVTSCGENLFNYFYSELDSMGEENEKLFPTRDFDEIKDQIYLKLAMIYGLQTFKSDESRLRKEILSAYSKFRSAGFFTVSIDLLCELISLLMVDDGLKVKLSDVKNEIVKLSEEMPKSVRFQYDKRRLPKYVVIDITNLR